MNEGWSPEQIAGWLKAGNEPGLRGLGTETIYRFVYRTRQKSEKLWKLLPRGKCRRGRRKRRATKSQIIDRRSIHERPQAVENRQKLGDWEADLMFCRRNQPVLVLHERASRLTLAAELAGKSAAETAATLMASSSDWHPNAKARSLSTSRASRQAAPFLQGPRPAGLGGAASSPATACSPPGYLASAA